MDKIISVLAQIGDFFGSLSDTIINVCSFILSILGFLWYGIKTLITGVGKLIYYITGIGFEASLVETFNGLKVYIGSWGVWFMASLLLIIFIRIIYGFVINLFRPSKGLVRSTNWKRDRNWEPTDIVEDVTYPRLPE